LSLRQAMRGPDKRVERLVRDYLNEIGYPELSYLRSEEATDLLNQVSELQASQQPPPPEPPQAAANSELAPEEAAQADLTDPPYETGKVFCKKDGDMVNRDWCSTYCDIRKRDGFCLYLGEEPPEAGGLI